MYSGNTSKKSKKAAIFCLNIPLTKSIDHPWGSCERGRGRGRGREREGVRWRGVFYPLITPTFTPSWLARPLLCCCWSHLCTIPQRATEIEVILCFSSPGPNLKSLRVSFHTMLSYGMEHYCRFFFLLLLSLSPPLSPPFFLQASGGGFLRT